MTPDLDNPIWSSLIGHHAGLAVGDGDARRYRDDVSMFSAVDPTAYDPWPALAALAGPGGFVGLAGGPAPPDDAGFTVLFEENGFRYVLDGPPRAPDRRASVDVLELGIDDRQEMFDLVQVAQPGPYAINTPDLGTYIGVRIDGRLLAMAGERMYPVGATEISAVATHPDARRRGLAAVLTAELARRIQARDELPFLHTLPGNVGAQRVYEALGFERRGTLRFCALQAPG